MERSMGEQGNRLVKWFVNVAVRLDRRLRLLDWAAQRSFDGPSKRFFGVDGYSPLALLVFAVALVFQILGPSLGWRGGLIAVALFVAAPILLAILVYFLGAYRLWLAEFVTVLLISAAVFFVFAAPASREPDDLLYRHVLAPALWVLLAAMLLARWLSRRMFRAYQGRFTDYLHKAELFVKPEAPTSVTSGSIVWSFLTVPVRHPLQLLLFPAFVVLVVQDARAMWWWSGALLLVSWSALTLASFHERLQFLVGMPRRVFFVGGQLVVSLVIIGLAIGRITDFSYIAILLDSAAGPIVAVLVFAAYFTFWFYEYWINRMLSEAMLGTLDGTTGRTDARINYPVDPAVIPDEIHVKSEQRIIQIHGSERFVAVGMLTKPRPDGPTEAFQFYGRLELFRRIFAWAARSKLLDFKEAKRLGHVLERKIQYYFLALNAALVVALAAAWLVLNGLPQAAELCVAPSGEAAPAGCVTPVPPGAAHGERIDLAGLISGNGQPAPQPVVLVAASGGGTRAALYTASVLHGLDRLGALQDVVLASGVSGGSAALAYFAAHRDTLINGNPQAWSRYMQVMSGAYIRDVLRGVVEWRIAGGTRLGTVLAESFKRRMQPPKDHRTLAGPDQIGLIFNTTLAGELHRNTATGMPLARWDAKFKRLTRADNAGGRLVLTNLDDVHYFPEKKVASLPPAHLKYVVVDQPGIPLTTAAALSANFPPVFADAAVDVKERDRYWVTDGGAADNRGLVSLLYALRHALVKLGQAPRRGPLPALYVVVAEASKEGFDFKQDRGIGAKSGAAEKFATQLSAVLWRDIKARYQALGGKSDNLRMYYLAMPLSLRARGGLGTHWILPNTVRLRDAVIADPDASEPPSVVLSGEQVRTIIDQLHSVERDPCARIAAMPDPRLRAVWKWICKDRVHGPEWHRLEADLGH
ncbi:MAG: patatin-like phospholipase family protein [Gammaproteobacteria bacterium]